MIEREKQGLEKQAARKSEIEAIEKVIITEFFPRFPILSPLEPPLKSDEERRTATLVDGRRLNISKLGPDHTLRNIKEYATADPLIDIHLIEQGDLFDTFADYKLSRNGSDIVVKPGVGFGFHFGDKRSPMERAVERLELKMKAIRAEELTDEEKAQLEQLAYDDEFMWKAFFEASAEFDRRKGSSQHFFSRKDAQELLLVIRGAASGEHLAEK